MTKFSPEYLKLADNLLQQFAQTQDDGLSAILTQDDLNEFQSQYKGGRVRDYPPLKTLCLFMRQVCSEQKSCRHALIEEVRDQVAQNCCGSGQESQSFKTPKTVLTAKPENG